MAIIIFILSEKSEKDFDTDDSYITFFSYIQHIGSHCIVQLSFPKGSLDEHIWVRGDNIDLGVRGHQELQNGTLHLVQKRPYFPNLFCSDYFHSYFENFPNIYQHFHLLEKQLANT